MTLSVTHAFSSGYTDGTDTSKLQPSNWNAAHVLTGVASLAQGGTGPFGAAGTILAGGAVPAWTAIPTITGPITIDKGTAAASAQSIVFKMNEVGAGDYSCGIYSVANAFGSRRDQVFKWGYNFDAPTNARTNTSEHALVYDIESFYNPSGGSEITESHIAYVNRAGTSFRPFSLAIDLLSDVISTDFVSDSFSITSGDGTTRFIVSAGDIILPIGSTIRKSNNNQAILRQINAAGTQNPSLIFLNNQDWLMLGDGNVADILWCTPLVTLGTTTLITLGKTGGSGPVTSAQNSWLRVLDNSGAACFIPVWK